MKKKILILLFGILMLLSACGTQAQPSESVERSDNAAEVTKEHIEETIETVKTPMLTEDIESVEAVEEVIPEEEFDLSVAQIEVDQQCWQASIDQRLVRSLYSKNAYSIEELENWGLFFEQGDFYLTRACHLVNWYYGCQFYD